MPAPRDAVRARARRLDRPIARTKAFSIRWAERWMRSKAALDDGDEGCLALRPAPALRREANAAKFLGARAGFDSCMQACFTHGGLGYAKE